MLKNSRRGLAEKSHGPIIFENEKNSRGLAEESHIGIIFWRNYIMKNSSEPLEKTGSFERVTYDPAS